MTMALPGAETASGGVRRKSLGPVAVSFGRAAKEGESRTKDERKGGQNVAEKSS